MYTPLAIVLTLAAPACSDGWWPNVANLCMAAWQYKACMGEGRGWNPTLLVWRLLPASVYVDAVPAPRAVCGHVPLS